MRFHRGGHHATFMSHICVCDKRHALIISLGVASSLFSTLNIATFSTLEFLHDWPRHASVILPLRERGRPRRRKNSIALWNYSWKSLREPYGRVALMKYNRPKRPHNTKRQVACRKISPSFVGGSLCALGYM